MPALTVFIVATREPGTEDPMRRRRWVRVLVFLGCMAIVLFIGLSFGIRTVLDVTAPAVRGEVATGDRGSRYWVRFVTDHGRACENDLVLHGPVQPGQTVIVRYYPPWSNPCGNSWAASDRRHWVSDALGVGIMALGALVLMIGWWRRDEIDRRWAAKNPWLLSGRMLGKHEAAGRPPADDAPR